MSLQWILGGTMLLGLSVTGCGDAVLVDSVEPDLYIDPGVLAFLDQGAPIPDLPTPLLIVFPDASTKADQLKPDQPSAPPPPPPPLCSSWSEFSNKSASLPKLCVATCAKGSTLRLITCYAPLPFPPTPVTCQCYNNGTTKNCTTLSLGTSACKSVYSCCF